MNQIHLTASIVAQDALRFTPAGVPAVDLRLSHESSQEEAGAMRQVKLVLRAVAFGLLAERLSRVSLQQAWRFTGFLASSPSGRSAVLHIQEFQPV